jgi:hypothetical protein
VNVDITCVRCLTDFTVEGWPAAWAATIPPVCTRCVTPAELMMDPPGTVAHIIGARRVRELQSIVEGVPV